MLPAVFLDRDETLIANATLPPPASPPTGWRPGDLYDPARVELLPGALEACRGLRSAGFVLVIVTNQGCVARGSATLLQVEAVCHRVCEVLRSEGGASLIARVYYAPYHPGGSVPGFAREHPWLKPGGGMLRQAARDLGLDLSRSWLIGDAERDREAGVHAGLPTEQCLRCGPGTTYPTVLDAAEQILSLA